MVDKLPKDLSEISDIKAMRVMMSQLIVTLEQQTKSIDNGGCQDSCRINW